MDRIKTGGPAHPIECHIAQGYRQDEGISQRAWFAGQAIGAVIQQCAGDTAFKHPGESLAEYFARTAYSIADAMLAIEQETDAHNSKIDRENDYPF